jgi:hypothetical protein
MAYKLLLDDIGRAKVHALYGLHGTA